jgi:RNA-binding protein NOB1
MVCVSRFRLMERFEVVLVIQWAKKTGDYAVLSCADLCILALTYSLHVRGKEEHPQKETSDACRDNGGLQSPPTIQPDQQAPPMDSAIYDDPSDSDDGEGEWITPSNVAIHKSRALDFLPTTSEKGEGVEETIHTGCMTADFAMQNVLLQMELNLVNVDGKRIKKVKTWVLRCHACFKYVSATVLC